MTKDFLNLGLKSFVIWAYITCGSHMLLPDHIFFFTEPVFVLSFIIVIYLQVNTQGWK